MAKKPSERRNFKDEDMELDLTPMMNLISILIPVLLISTAFVEIAVIDVSAPVIGPPDQQEEKPKDEKKPLNLTITVTDKGYILATTGEVAPGAGGKAGPTFPLKKKKVSCQRYMGTAPPPRAKNLARGKCEAEQGASATRTYEVYDTEALQARLIELKEAFPEERRMIIAAEPDIEFEAVTDVMDAGRDVKDEGGETRLLFNQVVLSPGMG